MEIKEIST